MFFLCGSYNGEVMTIIGLYWVEFCPSVKLQNGSADEETSPELPSKGVCRELVKYQLWVNCPSNMLRACYSSPQSRLLRCFSWRNAALRTTAPPCRGSSHRCPPSRWRDTSWSWTMGTEDRSGSVDGVSLISLKLNPHVDSTFCCSYT